MTEIDPVTLSVIRGQFEQLVNEMNSALVNSAFSPIICEAKDMANGLYRPNGNTVAQGDESMPIFVGNMSFSVRAVAEHFGDDLRPGDVVMTNDPYTTRTHLNDMNLIRPYFADDELVAFLASTGHWIDVGSANPGGFSGKTRQFYQEGIRIPPVKIYEGGDLDDDALEFIFTNVRSRENIEGDFKAQVNALTTGWERLQEVLNEHGKANVEQAIDELERGSERRMRNYVAEIPDGTFSYTDYVDNDGVVDEPLPIDLDLTIDGDSVTFDFTESADQCDGPVNAPRPATVSMCQIAFKHTFPDVPVNAGCFAPFDIEIPEGSFLDATPPSATAGYSVTCQRVIDTIFGALVKVLPEKVPAQAFSTSMPVSIGGETDGGEYVTGFYGGGGYGGWHDQDGLTYATPPFARASDPNVEVLEDRFPFSFTTKRLRENSAGPGCHRGGFGTVTDFEIADGTASVSCIADRADYPPNGVEGGKQALGTVIQLIRDGEPYTPALRTKDQNVSLSAGDRVHVESPGGGGYGDPLERNPELIREDVELGFITIEHALDEYGVVLKDGPNGIAIDDEATKRRRRRE